MNGYPCKVSHTILALDALNDVTGEVLIESITGNAVGNIVLHLAAGDAFIYDVSTGEFELVKNWREK